MPGFLLSFCIDRMVDDSAQVCQRNPVGEALTKQSKYEDLIDFNVSLRRSRGKDGVRFSSLRLDILKPRSRELHLPPPQPGVFWSLVAAGAPTRTSRDLLSA